MSNSNSSKGKSKLDPKLRSKLLKESQNPWRGIRRGFWIALFGSAFLGLLIMGTRFFAGEIIALSDIGIQVVAVLLFGSFLWLDKPKN